MTPLIRKSPRCQDLDALKNWNELLDDLDTLSFRPISKPTTTQRAIRGPNNDHEDDLDGIFKSESDADYSSDDSMPTSQPDRTSCAQNMLDSRYTAQRKRSRITSALDEPTDQPYDKRITITPTSNILSTGQPHKRMAITPSPKKFTLFPPIHEPSSAMNLTDEKASSYNQPNSPS
ncbi:MAG: hypothetical protein VXY77_02210 [Pseudomonadota bacterium]|nr:hypothetical protein [Pseudomonadota bacterium]